MILLEKSFGVDNKYKLKSKLSIELKIKIYK